MLRNLKKTFLWLKNGGQVEIVIELERGDHVRNDQPRFQEPLVVIAREGKSSKQEEKD